MTVSTSAYYCHSCAVAASMIEALPLPFTSNRPWDASVRSTLAVKLIRENKEQGFLKYSTPIACP